MCSNKFEDYQLFVEICVAIIELESAYEITRILLERRKYKYSIEKWNATSFSTSY